MANWSPQHAMAAYLNTLQLSQQYNNKPESMEFISALAAGNQVKQMIHITSNGPTLLTMALAVAAKETGGRVICVIPAHNNVNRYTWTENSDLKKVVKFVIGDPCEVMKRYKKVEFVIVDCKVENEVKVLRGIDVNSRGAIVVLCNVGVMSRGCFGDVLKGRRGVECVNAKAIGHGIELIKIGFERRRFNRFHVTFENSTN